MLPEEKIGFKAQEVQIGRHYWFVYRFEDIEVECVIKVLECSKNFIFGRVLDTEGLTIFFSRYRTSEDEVVGEDEELEVLAEHLIREVSGDELKTLFGLMDASVKDFFSVAPPPKRRFLN
jgi:hypothetical protein